MASPTTPAQQAAFRATSAVGCTPSDTTAQPFSALYIGVTGDVTITDLLGNVTTFAAHPVGYLPCSGRLVMATGTSASSIVLLN